MLVKLRDADEATIRRLFGQPPTLQAGNPGNHPES